MSTQRRPAKLLGFCVFLSQHVKCDNIELLTRAVCEFYREPRSFGTIGLMLRLSLPMIAIQPQTVSSNVERLQALERATRTRYEGDSEELVVLHCALKPRIILHNWDWLLQIYADYCVGADRTLVAFLRLRRQAISVIPATPFTSTLPIARNQHVEVVRTPELPELQSKTGVVKPKQSKKPSSAPGGASHLLTNITSDVQDLLDAIRSNQAIIERQKPWEKAFNVATIAYPCDTTIYPQLARAFERFWSRHARAVWERNFWCRFPQQTHCAEYEERKKRQRAAASTFEATVIVPLFNELGAEFFVELDEQSERHYWWWYRGPLVDLVCIASEHGLDACLEYQKSQARVRFPVSPDRGEFRPYLHQQDQGASMWCTMVNSHHIVEAINELKQSRTPKQIATGTRRPGADAE